MALDTYIDGAENPARQMEEEVAKAAAASQESAEQRIARLKRERAQEEEPAPAAEAEPERSGFSGILSSVMSVLSAATFGLVPKPSQDAPPDLSGALDNPNTTPHIILPTAEAQRNLDRLNGRQEEAGTQANEASNYVEDPELGSFQPLESGPLATIGEFVRREPGPALEKQELDLGNFKQAMKTFNSITANQQITDEKMAIDREMKEYYASGVTNYPGGHQAKYAEVVAKHMGNVAKLEKNIDPAAMDQVEDIRNLQYSMETNVRRDIGHDEIFRRDEQGRLGQIAVPEDGVVEIRKVSDGVRMPGEAEQFEVVVRSGQLVDINKQNNTVDFKARGEILTREQIEGALLNGAEDNRIVFSGDKPRHPLNLYTAHESEQLAFGSDALRIDNKAAPEKTRSAEAEHPLEAENRALRAQVAQKDRQLRQERDDEPRGGRRLRNKGSIRPFEGMEEFRGSRINIRRTSDASSEMESGRDFENKPGHDLEALAMAEGAALRGVGMTHTTPGGLDHNTKKEQSVGTDQDLGKDNGRFA